MSPDAWRNSCSRGLYHLLGDKSLYEVCHRDECLKTVARMSNCRPCPRRMMKEGDQ